MVQLQRVGTLQAMIDQNGPIQASQLADLGRFLHRTCLLVFVAIGIAVEAICYSARQPAASAHRDPEPVAPPQP